jgi:protein-tyrosine phosphatase
MTGGKTIVHCIAGVSRSVSLCAAYLMTNVKSENKIWGKSNMGSEEAVKYIKKRRRCANPNPGFTKH